MGWNKMKKKYLALALCTAIAMTSLVGCGAKKETPAPAETAKTEAAPAEKAEAPAEKVQLKVGMVTDSGTIDDKSFNQGTWEGIQKAQADLGIESNYLKPAGTTEADYLNEIANLYDTGYKFIVTPGFKFETAIFNAQDKYKDAKFVLIDGAPNNGKEGDARVSEVKANTVSIFFAEHESGFVAGVATALQLKEGELGFIGGMEIPPVQKFNWGFQQGIKYANDNLATKVSLKAENVVYEGSFSNVPAGQQIAAQMYDRDVKAIFCAAGGVGVGAITEAKERATKGNPVWIVGVDVDQYKDGVYEGEKSIILTSAMKKIGTAAYDMVKAEQDGKFPGGQTLIFDSKNNGVGLPDKNPNLSDDTTSKVAEVFKKLQSGEITVADKNDGSLIK